MNKFRIQFILLFLFTRAFSQVNDAGLWASLNAEKKITPRLSITLSEELRMNENVTEIGTYFTDAGVTYKIGKLFKVSVDYRFTQKRRLDDSYSKRHRLYLDLSARKKFKPVIITFRTRFQTQYADIYSSTDGKIPEYYSRNKLTFKFDPDKKFVPYVYSEIFTPLNKSTGLCIDNARYCAGVEYEFNRMHKVDVFYLVQKEYNVNDPETDFVAGIGYYLTF
jgi:hypothetical protein